MTISTAYPSAAPTGNAWLDSLIWGGSFAPGAGAGTTTITWTDAAAGTLVDATHGVAAQAWTAADLAALNSALTAWSNVADISFTYVAGGSGTDLQYFQVDSGGMLSLTGSTNVMGFHDVPGEAASSSTTLRGVFRAGDYDWSSLQPGGVSYYTLIHEIGHGLGLAHPHDGGAAGTPFPGVPYGSPYSLGNYQLNQAIWTAMSYNPGWTGQPTTSYAYGTAGSPMALDIAAIQRIYGANMSYRTGDDTYALPSQNAAGTGWSCIWDAGGNDTISNAGSSLAVSIDLRAALLTGAAAGGFVSWARGIQGGYTVANGAVIENAVGGSGADTLAGNSANNRLDGGAGADTLMGRAGNDTYVVDNVGERIYETTTAGGAIDAGGIDTVESGISYILGNFVENLTLTGSGNLNGTGNILNNTLTGNAGDNLLRGGAGNDILNGGTGNDTLFGGVGNDVYGVDSVGDIACEATTLGGTLNSGGIDRVESSVSFTLGSFVENLTLTGSADIDGTGNDLGNILIGNGGNNTLAGNGGSDTLNGGAGADVMLGGAGNDIYVIDNASDIACEATTLGGAINAGGTDTVKSYASAALGAFLENLTLLGSNAIDGTGNDLVNLIAGNGGDNRLDGGGGADTLVGGAGNDTYVVDNAADRIYETTVIGGGLDAGGTDTVESSISYLLGGFVENLTLVGSGNINGTGNVLANTLTGNSGNNVLNGSGGQDTLVGGTGNDTYIVDHAGDLVVEDSTLAAEIDTVRSTVGWTLGANLENLVLTGTGHINGTGNGLDNTITGNIGHNRLDGGLGADILIGGAGSDTYVIDDVGDKIYETTAIGGTVDAGGIDLVESSVTWKLGIYQDKLTLTGSNDIDGTGNGLANVVTGNAGSNTINGKAGSDTLTGGAGADTFVFDTTPSTANLDRIQDFVCGEDLLCLSTVFSTVGPSLDSGEFYAALGATRAVDADDRIIYNASTGDLYYDGDGLGGLAAAKVATLIGVPALSLSDFILV